MVESGITIDVMHCSMQFSDRTPQKKSDAAKILERADRRKVWWITGTEAGAGASTDLRAALEKECKAHNFRFHVAGDTWIAVNRDMIEPKSYDRGATKILDSSQGVGRHSDRMLTWASFTNPLVGKVSVACCHYLLQGSKPGDVNYALNKKIATTIGDWGKKAGAKAALAFYGGDQNIQDRSLDTFLGAPFTSLADELGKYESTGHGQIDVIASYNHDGRVKGKYWRALDDKEFPLNTDHYATEGGFLAMPVKTPKR